MRKMILEQKAKLLMITCDRCQTTYHPEEGFADKMEALEFLSYEDDAGFGSKFIGDGVHWSLDLCQNCTHDLLGPYIRKSR